MDQLGCGEGGEQIGDAAVAFLGGGSAEFGVAVVDMHLRLGGGLHRRDGGVRRLLPTHQFHERQQVGRIEVVRYQHLPRPGRDRRHERGHEGGGVAGQDRMARRVGVEVGEDGALDVDVLGYGLNDDIRVLDGRGQAGELAQEGNLGAERDVLRLGGGEGEPPPSLAG